MRRVQPLDGIRGIAILMVIAFHFLSFVGLSTAPERAVLAVSQYGWGGVEVFFALSGYLITGILWDGRDEGRGQLGRFYARRILRIWPLYFGVLAVLTAISAGAYLAQGNDWAGRFLSRMGWLWCHAANVGLALRGLDWFSFRVFECAHFWTLAVEEPFYLVWPWRLALCRSRRQGLVLCLGGVLVAMGLRWFLHRGELAYAVLATPRQAASILIGSALALALRGPDPSRVGRLAAGLGVAAGLAFAGLAAADSGQLARVRETIHSPLLGLAAAGLIGHVVTRPAGRVARALSARWLRTFGFYGYGLYIYHQLFLPLWIWLMVELAEVTGYYRVGVAGMLVIAVSASLGLSVLSYHLYEEPFLRLKRHFERPRRPETPATGPVVPTLERPVVA